MIKDIIMPKVEGVNVAIARKKNEEANEFIILPKKKRYFQIKLNSKYSNLYGLFQGGV